MLPSGPLTMRMVPGGAGRTIATAAYTNPTATSPAGRERIASRQAALRRRGASPSGVAERASFIPPLYRPRRPGTTGTVAYGEKASSTGWPAAPPSGGRPRPAPAGGGGGPGGSAGGRGGAQGVPRAGGD